MESVGVEYMKYGAIGLCAFVVLVLAAFALRSAMLSHKTFQEESKANRADSAAARDSFLKAMEAQRVASQSFQEKALAPIAEGMEKVCSSLGAMEKSVTAQLAALTSKVDDCPDRGKP